MKSSIAIIAAVGALSLSLTSSARADIERPGGNGGTTSVTAGNGGSTVVTSGGTGGISTGGNAGSGTTITTTKDDSGCAISSMGSRNSLAGLMLAVGAGLLLVDRRRKR